MCFSLLPLFPASRAAAILVLLSSFQPCCVLFCCLSSSSASSVVSHHGFFSYLSLECCLPFFSSVFVTLMTELQFRLYAPCILLRSLTALCNHFSFLFYFIVARNITICVCCARARVMWGVVQKRSIRWKRNKRNFSASKYYMSAISHLFFYTIYVQLAVEFRKRGNFICSTASKFYTSVRHLNYSFSFHTVYVKFADESRKRGMSANK